MIKFGCGIIMGEENRLNSDAFEWAYNEFVAGDPESEALFKEYEVKADIGQQIYDLRNQANLTQAALAELVGTTESVIQELEEADYEGDSLGMLVRIGSALNKKIEVRFVPAAPAKTGDASEFRGDHA